jgi:alpha-L-fucosidase 2
LDGESAYGQIAETLGTHIYENLWAVHPPFQIDANFGYAAAVNEMLVQSHLKTESHRIHLLPALPQAWADGRARGLRVRGGFEVDMEWKDSQLTQARIRNISSPRDECVVCYGDNMKTCTVAQGRETVLTPSSIVYSMGDE